jgi:UDP-N-acetylmuramoyl-L-alanyl-D-glutamate--2,6-diaminopimelate ligase
MTMKFLQLLDGAEILAQRGNPEITGLHYDSRQVGEGEAFVAMRGASADGNRFIDAAIARGAAAVVTDSAEEPERPQVAWARVSHGRRALARLSANFYGRPAEKLSLTGITGTNGKTTSAFLLETILQSAGRQTLLLGTVEYHVAGRTLPAPHTTPEALELNQLFAQAAQAGATEGVLEVSSHALAQQRVFGVPFDVAVFTNLTRDHLDYHRDMDDYFAVKSVLFAGCGTEPPRACVVNMESDYGVRIAAESRGRGSQVWTYGIQSGDFRAEELYVGQRGLRFRMQTPVGTVEVASSLLGRINVYNLLAASAAAVARGCGREHLAGGLANLPRVPGRFERVEQGQPFTVVVDYAHTDDALRNLTAVAREFAQQAGLGGRVITVFGCGGDRDRAKRPLMGEAAGQGSDFVVLTSDNPRSEDPLTVISDALVGLQRSQTPYRLEPDRRKAIAAALGEAQPGDIVLIAGKGHEKVQVTREGPVPFDDVEVARAALEALGYAAEPAAPRSGS